MSLKVRLFAVFATLLFSYHAQAQRIEAAESKAACAHLLIKASMSAPLTGDNMPALAERLKLEDLKDVSNVVEDFTMSTARFVFKVTDENGNKFYGRLRMKYSKMEDNAYTCAMATDLPMYEYTIQHFLTPNLFKAYILKNASGKVVQEDEVYFPIYW